MITVRAVENTSPASSANSHYQLLAANPGGCWRYCRSCGRNSPPSGTRARAQLGNPQRPYLRGPGLRSARAARDSPVIASQWVMGWDLNENDGYPVRIGDPHLQQTPRFPFGCTHDLNTRRLKAPVFGSEVPDL